MSIVQDRCEIGGQQNQHLDADDLRRRQWCNVTVDNGEHSAEGRRSRDYERGHRCQLRSDQRLPAAREDLGRCPTVTNARKEVDWAKRKRRPVQIEPIRFFSTRPIYKWRKPPLW